jgi:hypothetical protein
MVEVIRHLFGACGETNHPSLLCMLGFGPILLLFKGYLRYYYDVCLVFTRNLIQRIRLNSYHNQKQ